MNPDNFPWFVRPQATPRPPSISLNRSDSSNNQPTPPVPNFSHLATNDMSQSSSTSSRGRLQYQIGPTVRADSDSASFRQRPEASGSDDSTISSHHTAPDASSQQPHLYTPSYFRQDQDVIMAGPQKKRSADSTITAARGRPRQRAKVSAPSETPAARSIPFAPFDRATSTHRQPTAQNTDGDSMNWVHGSSSTWSGLPAHHSISSPTTPPHINAPNTASSTPENDNVPKTASPTPQNDAPDVNDVDVSHKYIPDGLLPISEQLHYLSPLEVGQLVYITNGSGSSGGVTCRITGRAADGRWLVLPTGPYLVPEGNLLRCLVDQQAAVNVFESKPRWRNGQQTVERVVVATGNIIDRSVSGRQRRYTVTNFDGSRVIENLGDDNIADWNQMTADMTQEEIDKLEAVCAAMDAQDAAKDQPHESSAERHLPQQREENL